MDKKQQGQWGRNTSRGLKSQKTRGEYRAGHMGPLKGLWFFYPKWDHKLLKGSWSHINTKWPKGKWACRVVPTESDTALVSERRHWGRSKLWKQKSNRAPRKSRWALSEARRNRNIRRLYDGYRQRSDGARRVYRDEPHSPKLNKLNKSIRF